jgi:hypothetical protein
MFFNKFDIGDSTTSFRKEKKIMLKEIILKAKINPF